MPRTVRKITDPSRGLTPEGLRKLGREERRQLVQSLLTQEGRRVIELSRRADFDDFLIEVSPLWRTRRARVRVLYRKLRPGDVSDLQDLSQSVNEVDAVLVQTEPTTDPVQPSAIHLVSPDDLIERIEASPIVEWEGTTPTVRRERFELFKDLTTAPLLLDVLGLRWLPVLSLNKVPGDLSGTEVAADSLLEESAFRIFTAVFRFSGTRLGSKVPGSRDPDALLITPARASTRFGLVLDCKGARDGYRMSADEERRFVEYIRKIAKEPLGVPLKYLVVLSSFFPRDKRSDPFKKRSRAIRKATGVELVYLQASDLARLGLALQDLDPDTLQREGLNWAQALDLGRVTSLESMLEGLT